MQTTAFASSEYAAMKRKLSFRPSTPVTLAVLGTSLALFGVALWLVRRPGVPCYLLSQALFAVSFFQGFGLLHECGHGNASSRSAVNVVVGHLASLLCFLPFFPWKYIHQEHHVWTGHLTRDPTMDAVRRWRESRRVPALVRLAWRSWIPLAAVVQHVVFWAYPLKLVRSGRADRRQTVRCAFSVLFLTGGYIGLHVAWPGLFRFANFGLALLVYLVAVEMVNLPHHLGTPTTEERLPPWEQWRASRSCLYPRGVSEFLVLNFNFHVEHHLFPSLPWFRLRQAQRLVAPALPGRYQQEIGISWNLRNRRGPLEPLALDEPARGDAAR